MANSAKLGERKNVNLPGVHVDLPVLTEKDIDDLQNFCCHHRMDMVAASFVQTASDVRLIRTILDMAGGSAVKVCAAWIALVALYLITSVLNQYTNPYTDHLQNRK